MKKPIEYSARVNGSLVKNLLVLIAITSIVKLLFFILGIINFPIPISEAWKDYFYAYVPAVQAFKNGSLPYKDFYHAYPPLFLYTLTAFSFSPYIWSMALPLLVADILTAIPVYLISRHILTEHYALLSSIIFAMAPINLAYVDYLWLNPPLTTLLLVTSILLILKGRCDISATCLALSIGFKQTSIIILPIILFYVSKKWSRIKALRYLIIVTIICIIFSIPYIIISPQLYLLTILRVPIEFGFKSMPENYFKLPISLPPGQTIETFNTETLDMYSLKMMKYVPLNSPVNLYLPIFVYLLPENLQNIYTIAKWTLTPILLITYGTLVYKIYKKKEISEKELIKYSTYSMLIFLTFYPIYKYYVAGATSILSLYIYNRKNAIIFIIINLALIAIPRLLTSYITLLTLTWILGIEHLNKTK